MATEIPAGFEEIAVEMAEAQATLRGRLDEMGYVIDDYPTRLGLGNPEGVAAARAYPIQGVLKYHGMPDWRWRTAYLPSISLNNDAAETWTVVEFDPDLPSDTLTMNGVKESGRTVERVSQMLDVLRQIAGVTAGARVTSRNVTKASKTGKGLGTSASASASLAMASIAALFGPKATLNTRFVTATARLLAGSGCRSAAGGLALWLSYPGVAHEDSFAVRLDAAGQMDDVRLITVPLDSRLGLKTESAHSDAANSSLFKCWMRNRLGETLECMDAIATGDWRTMAQMAEVDSIQLHGVTMSGSRENKVFAWEPENITLFRLCNELREAGTMVYFSTDTGPTMVFITDAAGEDAVVAAIEGLQMGFEVVRGKIGGPAALVGVSEARGMVE